MDNHDPFADSRLVFEEVVDYLGGATAAGCSHAELEEVLHTRGLGLLCALLQDHMDLRAAREPRLAAVTSVTGIRHAAVEPDHARPLASIFGPVRVRRLAYRHRGQVNLHPADAALNLPVELHSHGLRRLAALEASRGSFDQARQALARATGQPVGKRQLEQLTVRAAVDIDDFYATKPLVPAADGDVLVISADGKGIVMRPEALRAATAKAAATATNKLTTRLSKGEKGHRKRMATIGAVYDATPAPRTPTDVLARADADQAPAPKAANKWLTASVTDDAATVVAAVFDHAQRRDPDHTRTWIALVDGNNHQIARIHAEATRRGVTVTIVCDLVHVMEYIWKAAWCFHTEGDPAAETWVHDKTMAVLGGHASQVAAAIRRTATNRNLSPTARKPADTTADYLLNKAPCLDYPTALAKGWPIATGVIEGACRHLVVDRLDITGARWGLQGAEAVLKLRAIHSNGDFDQYWHHHLTREQQRIHHPRYNNQILPLAA